MSLSEQRYLVLTNAANVRQLELFCPFGTGDNELNLNFTWIDSDSGLPCSGYDAQFERASCLYNAAVYCYHIGISLKHDDNAEKLTRAMDEF